MAFEDIKESIAWAQAGEGVFAYFTAHSARTSDNHEAAEHDTVRYACGELEAVGNMLSGDLTAVFANTGVVKTPPLDASDPDVFIPSGDPDLEIDVGEDVGEVISESMEYRPRLAYRLKLRPDGKISLRLKIDGKFSSSRPEVTVAGSSISPGLLHGASPTASYTVSLDRQDKIPPPK